MIDRVSNSVITLVDVTGHLAGPSVNESQC